MALRAPGVPDASLDTTGPLEPTFHLPPVRYARRPSRPPDASASSRPLSYSEWESDPVSEHLIPEPFSGILDDSLSSDGLAEVRRKQRKRGPKGHLGRSKGSKKGDPSEGQRQWGFARTGAQEPQQARRRPHLRAPENRERRFEAKEMVEENLLASKQRGFGRPARFRCQEVLVEGNDLEPQGWGCERGAGSQCRVTLA